MPRSRCTLDDGPVQAGRLRDGMPARQAFVNGLIPSEQRGTVLSFDSLMGSLVAWSFSLRWEESDPISSEDS